MRGTDGQYAFRGNGLALPMSAPHGSERNTFWEPMMQHSDFKPTDDELKRINEIIQKQIVPGKQNDGVVIPFMYWVATCGDLG